MQTTVQMELTLGLIYTRTRRGPVITPLVQLVSVRIALANVPYLDGHVGRVHSIRLDRVNEDKQSQVSGRRCCALGSRPTNHYCGTVCVTSDATWCTIGESNPTELASVLSRTV